jgi:hypothetical protein
MNTKEKLKDLVYSLEESILEEYFQDKSIFLKFN